jgi:uncharacterized protein (DUF2147 family)
MKQRVIRILVLVLIFSGVSSPSFASPPDLIGYWTTGPDQAVTQIYSCGNNLLCGELVGFPMDHASDPMPMTWNHEPQCHFVFIRYLHSQGNFWTGTIINPKSGNHFGVEVRLISENRLKLRGYVLLQMLGSTRFWTRYDGLPPPADCRMPPHSLN